MWTNSIQPARRLRGAIDNDGVTAEPGPFGERVLGRTCTSAWAPIVLFLLQSVGTIWACDYNVRDTGFVDLGMNPYWYYAFVDDHTPTEVVSALAAGVGAALADTGIHAQVIHVDQQTDSAATRFLPSPPVVYPAAVLVSPHHRVMTVRLPEADASFAAALDSILRDLVWSPVRQRLLKNLPQALAVVLVIPGPDAKENAAARTSATLAIDQITRQMSSLPKGVSGAPVLLEMDPAEVPRERVSLWCLEMDTFPPKTAAVAVLFGRARRLGPLLAGDQVTCENIVSLLFLAGADCECGLDRSWLAGTPVPVPWDEEARRGTLQSLGFDPENPLTKMEIDRILRRRDPGLESERTPRVEAGRELPFGYREVAAGLSDPLTETIREHPEPNGLVDGRFADPQPGVRFGGRPGGVRNTVLVLGGLSVLVLASGAFVLLRSLCRK